MSNTERPSKPRHTVVEEGTEFKGTLNSSCPIDVRGRIEGEVVTPALTVSASGAVHGRAKVGAVRSEGELSGEFDADSVELSGSVRDNTIIRTRSLEVKLSSERGKLEVVFGECELSVGEEPTLEDRVEPTMQPVVEEVVALPATIAEAMADASLPADMPADAEGADGEEDDSQPDAAEQLAGAPAGKRRRKRKNGQPEEAIQTGWSAPPSQPPPAS